MNKSNTATATVTTASINAPKRGLKKAEVVKIVAGFKFPTTPFTMKDLFASVGVEHWYITNYVKANGKIVGDAPKTAGARGPAPKLWQLNGTK